jgi:hypothetical protein
MRVARSGSNAAAASAAITRRMIADAPRTAQKVVF